MSNFAWLLSKCAPKPVLLIRQVCEGEYGVAVYDLYSDGSLVFFCEIPE